MKRIEGEQASGSAHQQLFFLWICVALVAHTGHDSA
jgi:hypothetical protein